MEESIPLVENKHGREDDSNVSQPGYQGYEPVYPADFPFEEDYRETHEDENDRSVDPNMLRDNASTSKSLLVFSTFFGIAFIAMLVWQILVAKCRVTNLCETIDQSSIENSDYLFQTFSFRTPSALIWLGLTCGTLGLLISSVLAVFVMRKKVGTSKMAEIATVVRKGSSTFIAHQNFAMLAPVAILFLLLGFGINWRTAGSFALGSVVCMTTTDAGISIATRGNVRASAAAHEGLTAAMKVAYRSGAIAGVSIISIALIGMSAAYLMFADIRSLAGFAAGASTASLFLRVSGGIFTRATSKTASLVQPGERNSGNTRSRRTRRMATYVGSGVGTVFGLGPDLFESFVGAVIATAILGSSLPFFYRDSFAICVYNHLEIDQFCGPFGYPQQLSYAIYICRNANLYVTYPSLTTWSSNTAFIAVPFVLSAAGLLVSLICTLYVHANVRDLDLKSDKRTASQKLRFGMRANMLLGSFLLIVSSAALFFGLFGPRSVFQDARGLSSSENLPRMQLQESQNSSVCLSSSLTVTDTSAFNPSPVPQGGQYILDRYRPVNDSGKQIGPANTTDRRLFGCAVIGILLGVLMTGFCSTYFTSEAFQPTQRVAEAAEFGVTPIVMQGFANGLLGSIPPTALLLIGIISSHALYGAYGVGVMSVAFLSATGVVATGSVFGSIADNARGIARMASFTRRARRGTIILDNVGASISVSGTEFANSGAFLAAVTLLFATIQTSGMFPAPREIVGTPEQPFTRLIWRVEGVPVWHVHVLVGLLIGVAHTFIVAGLLLIAVRRAALAMALETKRHSGGNSDRYFRFVGAVTRACLIESVIPVLVMFSTPLIVGFGFGQRALLAMLVAATGTGFVLSTWVTSTAGCWEGAERYVAEGNSQLGTAKHWSTLYARELGSPLRECVAPGLQSMMKTGAAVSLVAVTLMQRDSSKGWIGGVVLTIVGLLTLIFAIWKTTRNTRLASTSKRGDATTVPPPPKRVSPFYVQAATIDPRATVPGSQMAEAIDAVGYPSTPIRAELLPGLSDRSQADLGNLQHLQSPRAIVDGEGYVVYDEARLQQ